MTRKALLINSDVLVTEPYLSALKERGFEIDSAFDTYEGIGKLDNSYDFILFSPYFLTLGLKAYNDYPDAKSLNLDDPLSVGFWMYNKLKESKNANVPVFLIPLGLSRSIEYMERCKSFFEEEENIILKDLIDTLPSELVNIVEKTLRGK